jgi:hypothetical protein
MTTLSKAILAGSGVTVLITYAIATFRRTKQLSAGLLGLGAVFLMIVVVTHVAEALRLWPWMHWGQPTSPGHYLDLASAVHGVVFVVASCALAVATRWLARPAKSSYQSRR